MFNEYKINTSGYNLSGKSWTVDEPRAAVCLIHGIGEHCGRYAHVAEKMNEAGYSVYAIDLPGHGLSDGKRGHAGSTDELMEVVDELINYARNESKNIPIFVMGHSMGGNIVLSHRFYRQGANILGYISGSPWLKTNNAVLNDHYKLSRLAADIMPKLAIVNTSIRIPLCTNRAKAPVDELCHFKITLRTAADRERDARLVLENAAKGRPVYLFVGDQDRVCFPSAARRFSEIAGKNCVFREWEGLNHETMNESTWEDVVSAVIEWMNTMLL